MKIDFLNFLEKANRVFKQSVDTAFQNKKITHSFLLKADKNTSIDNSAYYLILKIIELYKGNLYDLNYLKEGKYFDFLELKPINDTIKKTQVLDAIQLFLKTSFESNSPKILYIANIEKGNSSSLNSLLKYIENPPKDTFIVMGTNNIKKVISTIVSRSQVFDVKRMNQLAIEELFLENDLEKYVIKFYARVFDNWEDANKYNSKKYFELVKKTLKNLDKSLINKYSLINFLEEVLDVENYYFVLQVIRIFFEDVFASHGKDKIAFLPFYELVQKYQEIKVQFYPIYYFIEEFLSKLEINTNFKIQKQFFLLKVSELYGN
ncbi:DNA polymerase III subunit delta' [[Mycoplasma] mobile]|uniref:DNA polymerase III subunit delta n=1 Tax=Mycoplasma mobile (strain ATCC 43663 / 163K / NCTC 11711) TaxID=267748 RepID=Q6KHB8_MYCM1|nr:DNA polymerase III subunit delta' [[Mycoplasma] mobile]AAT28012.1 DNA polymerase III subunit delta [Mycoplasma mobile 163K]